MLRLDFRSRTPIYEQIIESVKTQVLAGILKPDQQLPSIRALAASLAINPNTIQKAFAELERTGVIYSLTGRGSFVSDKADELVESKKSELLNKMRETASQLLDLGVNRETLLSLIPAAGSAASQNSTPNS